MSTPQAFPRHPKLLPTFGNSKDIAVKDKFFEYSLDKRRLSAFRVASGNSARVPLPPAPGGRPAAELGYFHSRSHSSSRTTTSYRLDGISAQWPNSPGVASH